MISVLKFPRHAQESMAKRGITEIDAEEAVERGEVVMEEVDGRLGLKKYSKLEGKESDLIVIWFVNKPGEKEVVTAYWRRKRRR